MKKRIPIAIAAALTACGAVATTSNDSAESAPQKSAKAKQPPRVGFESFDKGGMAGCFDPKLSGYARAAAERIGGVPCKTSTSAQSSGAPSAGGESWLGKYAGDGDGGTTEFTVTSGGGIGRYFVDGVLVGENGCTGELSGQAVASDNRLTLTVPIPGERRQCQMTFTRQGRNVAVREGDNCSHFHGMSCGFTGSAQKVSSADPLEPSLEDDLD